MTSILNNYTDEEFANIVKNSTSYREIARKLGYSDNSSGDTIKKIQARVKQNNLNTEHFNTYVKNQVELDKIFIENSNVVQSTLRKYYTKLNLPYVCTICGQIPIWNNKPLTLILDHINGHNRDNRIENLRWICPNCNQQLETTGSKNRQKNPIKRYYCIDCGKEISKGATRCQQCNNKTNFIPPNQLPVTREELKDLLRNNTFRAVAKKYNMSESGMRHWCDKLNLPRTVKDIKSYTDIEWENL